MAKKTNQIDKYFISKNASIGDAIVLIENNNNKIAVVVDEQNILQGTITDGDIRRGILGGKNLQSPTKDIMNRAPFFIYQDEGQKNIIQVMHARKIKHALIVDDKKVVVDLIGIEEILSPKKRDNWVVIMAGGLGKRLHPLTQNTPKPMLPVAGTPVIEHLIIRFISQGFHRFYLSINYLGDQIKEYFKDGSHLGVQIRYVEEDKPMQTAGSLALLPERPKDAFIVINGDIITNVDFVDMLDFHASSHVKATIGIREHDVTIPYGVVSLEGDRVIEFQEKPQKSFFINTGIYIIEPEILDIIKGGKSITMPALLMCAKEQDEKSILAFPVREHWLDIGRIEDFTRAETLVHQITSEELAKASK